MTARDPDDRIPEARLEPRNLAEHMVRAGANAKRGGRRAARAVRHVLLIVLGVGVLSAALTLWPSRQHSRDDDGLERMKAEFREIVEQARRAEEQKNLEYAQELECRPPEYRPDVRDAPAFTP